MTIVVIDGVNYVPEVIKSTDKTLLDALDVRFYHNDLKDDITVREFLLELLSTLWEEEERFSGKRPFGNGNWKWDVHQALGKAGFVSCKILKEGKLEYIEMSKEQQEAADEYMQNLIHALFNGIASSE